MHCKISKRFLEAVKDLDSTQNQVYNCDETALNWKALPTKTFLSGCEKGTAGFKLQNNHITVLLIFNAAGSHRFPATVIGKSKKPIAFMNINMKALLANYYDQKSVWVTQDIKKCF